MGEQDVGEVYLVFRCPSHRNADRYVVGAWSNRESADAQAKDIRKLDNTDSVRVEYHRIEDHYEGTTR